MDQSVSPARTVTICVWPASFDPRANASHMTRARPRMMTMRPNMRSHSKANARSCQNFRAAARLNPEAWRVRRQLDARDELDAGPRVVAEQEVSVEIDVVDEARDVGRRRDPEAGLDHATEHHG